MMTAKKNIFTADDALIKTGYILLFLVLFSGLIAWPLLAGQKVHLGPGVSWFVVLAVFVLVIMPILFLTTGYVIRAKEKKYLTG